MWKLLSSRNWDLGERSGARVTSETSEEKEGEEKEYSDDEEEREVSYRFYVVVFMLTCVL